MAGTKISDYALGDSGTTKWTNFLTTIEKQRKGFIQLSLTNYDNSSLPAIEAGSYVEVSGALYGFTSDEAIAGTPTSGSTNYIYIDASDVTAHWTTTAPTWSSVKGGWYDSGETYRYIGGCYYDGTNYTGKWVYNKQDSLTRGTQTIYGAKTFNDEIYDKNGNEVVAMQIETKSSTPNTTIGSASSGSITITGFSFNPTAVLGLVISYGFTDGSPDRMIGLGTTSADNDLIIESITFGTGSITVNLFNGNSSSTIYVEYASITAART